MTRVKITANGFIGKVKVSDDEKSGYSNWKVLGVFRSVEKAREAGATKITPQFVRS